MFSNLTNILDSLDNVAKDVADDDEDADAPSATWVRSQQRKSQDGRLDERNEAADGLGVGTERKTENIKRDLRGEMSVIGKDEMQNKGAEVDLAKRVGESEYGGSSSISTPYVHQAKSKSWAESAAEDRESMPPPPIGSSRAQSADGRGITSSNTTTTKVAAAGGRGDDVEDLEAEIERLNTECLELEDQVNSLKSEGQEAWASYQRAQEHAAVREGELQDEIKALNKACSQDKQQHLAQITKLRGDCDSSIAKMREAVQEKESVSVRMVALQAEEDKRGAEWSAREQELLTELAVAKAGSASGAQGLRDDLKVAVEASERLRTEHSSFQRQAQTRQTQLETSAAELTRVVTMKERELQEMKSRQTAGGAGASRDGGEGNQRADELLEQLQQAREGFATEQDKARQLESRLVQVERDYHHATVGYEDERAQLKGELLAANRRVTSLVDQQSRQKEALAEEAARAAAPKAEESAATEQVQSLSKQLLRKQQMVLELQAERSALKSRLADMTAKAEHAERQLLESGDGDYGLVDDYDGTSVESGGYYRYKDSPQGSTGLVKRGSAREDEGGFPTRDGGGRAAAEMERYGVKAPKPVATAVNAIDSWTLVTGRYLRTSPLIRVAITIYLLVLHVWVFVVLAMHTHSLDGPGAGGLASADPKDFVKNKLD